MKLFKRKLKRDNRGLSMIELICAVAILGAVSTAIAGAMVMSSDSYRRGTTEAELQQNAQFTANVISDLIVDATNEVNFTGGILEINNTEADGTNVTYQIMLDDSTHELWYYKGSESGLLASNVTSFSVTADDFDVSRNAIISLGMSKDGSDISVDYNITSRNEPKSTLASVNDSAVIQCEDEITLEPNQEYTLKVDVSSAGSASTTYTGSITGNTADTTATKLGDGSGFKISVAKAETGSGGKVFLTIKTSDNKATKTVTINIRRVTGFENIPRVLLSGTDLEENAVYEIPAKVVGTNLSRVYGKTYDNDYKDPYGATWTFSDNSYVDIIAVTNDSSPYIRFKLKKTITPGAGLTLTVTAKHPMAAAVPSDSTTWTNKTGKEYDTVTKVYEFKVGGAFANTGDFFRGDDNDHIVYDYISGYVGDPQRYWRAREVELDDSGNVISGTEGTWTLFKKMINGGNDGTRVFVRPGDYDLNPNKSYQWQIQGRDFRDDDGNMHPNHGESYCPSCTSTFTIPAANMLFNQYTISGTSEDINPPTSGVGTKENPVLCTPSNDILYFRFDAGAATVDKCFREIDYKFIAQEWNGSDWNTVGDDKVQGSEIEYTGNDAKGNHCKGNVKIYVKKAGVYRVLIDWNTANMVSRYGDDSPYYNIGTGKGVIYVTAVQTLDCDINGTQWLDGNQYFGVNFNDVSDKQVKITKDGIDKSAYFETMLTNQVHIGLTNTGRTAYNNEPETIKGAYDVEITYKKNGVAGSVSFRLNVK